MKAVIALINSMWAALFAIPLFDLPMSFGSFIMALVVTDIIFIWLKKVVRKEDTSNSAPKNSTKTKE